MKPFRSSSRATANAANANDAGWFPVGPASSFPDIQSRDEEGKYCLSDLRFCDTDLKAGCKVFRAPPRGMSGGGLLLQTQKGSTGPQVVELPLSELQLGDGESVEMEEADLKDQVLVFRFQGKFHAVDHRCPHSSYPLSRGVPFDIEDFGIVLSAGITCPKHSWSFDLFSGMSDRARYKLGVWEVQLRDAVVVGGSEATTIATTTLNDDNDDGDTLPSGGEEKEVWVRRKQRIG